MKTPLATPSPSVTPPVGASQVHSLRAPAAKDLKRGAIRGGAITVGSQGAKFLIQTLATVILARLLTPEDYGDVAMVSALLGFVTLFKDLGLSTATIQRDEISQEQVSGMFWINVATGIAMMLLIAAAAPLVAWFYGKPELRNICLGFALIAPLSSIGAQHAALLQRQMKFMSMAIRDIGGLAAGLIASILAAYAGWGYWALVIQQGAAAAVGTALLWWQSGWRPSRPARVKNLGSMVRFGGKLTLSNIFTYISGSLDSILLGHFFGSAAVGTYNRAQMILAKPLKQFLPPIVSVATPTFSRLKSDAARFERNALTLTGLVAVGSCLMVGVFMPTADWVVHLMLGGQWQEAVAIFRVLALFAFVEPIASVLSVLMIVSGKPGKLAKWKFFSTGIIVAGLAAGVPYGPVGVATTFAVSGLVVRAPLFIWYAGRNCGIRPTKLFVTVGPFVTFGALIAFAGIKARAIWSPENPVIGIIAYGLGGTLLYGALVLATRSGRSLIVKAKDLASTLRPGSGRPSNPRPADAETASEVAS
ncbi:MAG: lipopolysaccharide biosynthesis protein [Verrucomicrobiales bacterium]|nr:lipopolysaccharide biosynthesis protein [Verrucomicrobiales bacterium]